MPQASGAAPAPGFTVPVLTIQWRGLFLAACVALILRGGIGPVAVVVDLIA